jgi:hypothetical protein
MALFLKEISGAPLRKGLLWLPLALACLISEYSRLVFPMRSSVSWVIDSAFDEVLRYLDLGKHRTLKDFVAKSKGILYAKDLTAKESARVLERAAFILTTDEKIAHIALGKRLPHVFISQPYGKELDVRAHYIEGDYYDQLKRNFPRYVEISSQIGYLAGTNRLKNSATSYDYSCGVAKIFVAP